MLQLPGATVHLLSSTCCGWVLQFTNRSWGAHYVMRNFVYVVVQRRDHCNREILVRMKNIVGTIWTFGIVGIVGIPATADLSWPLILIAFSSESKVKRKLVQVLQMSLPSMIMMMMRMMMMFHRLFWPMILIYDSNLWFWPMILVHVTDP